MTDEKDKELLRTKGREYFSGLKKPTQYFQQEEEK